MIMQWRGNEADLIREGFAPYDALSEKIQTEMACAYASVFWQNSRLLGHALLRTKFVSWVDHQLHYMKGPALVDFFGSTKEWWTFGLPHRLDGPALNHGPDWDDTSNKWYIHGIHLREIDFRALVKGENPVSLAIKVISQFGSPIQNELLFARTLSHIEKTLRHHQISDDVIKSIVATGTLL